MDVTIKRFPISAWVGIVLFGFGLFALISAGIVIFIIASRHTGGFGSNGMPWGDIFLAIFFAIPTAFGFWAALRLRKRGANTFSGVVYLIVALLNFILAGFMLIVGISLLGEVAQNTSSPEEGVGFIIGIFLPTLIVLLVAIWLGNTSVRILRAKPQSFPNVDVFE